MILETNILTKNYGPFRALDALTIEIRPGEIVGLLGPNGSGKSTALRLMLGFLRPTSGTARIAGHDCWRESHLARRHVAYLPGELRLYENMTGKQVVEFLGRLRPGVENRDYGALADRFDIDLLRPLAQLSSGMKRKVALLAVLTPHTPVLILDEPTNTLDPTMRDEFLAQLRETRRRGQAVLFSSHVLGEVEAICDRVAILKNGRLVHEEAIADLRAVQRVRVSFAAEMGTIPDFKGLRRVTREGRHIDFEWSGPLSELLAWLGSQQVAEMKMDAVGLARVYHAYHGAAAADGLLTAADRQK
jgi:ABC-2 type transport system ATP-binding protein